MSIVYSLEPRTRGRAILHTTHGPLELFLWSDECPQAVRNFVQHALNGYYDGLPFHRVLPGVLAQTGDPTRTGSGGEPATGDPAGFPRESHGRLKFRRRGIAAMVADEEGKVRSQFFFTLAATPWLDGKHTIFGQVQGDTVFNLLNLAANEVDSFDGDDIPRVKTIDIAESPFPDIVAIPKLLPRREPAKLARTAAPTAKRAVKSSKLLSFQDDFDSDSDDDNSFRSAKQVKRRRRPLESAQTLPLRKNGVKGDEAAPNPIATEREQGTSKSTKVTTPSTKPGNAVIIRQAEEKFERLKAEYLGGGKPATGDAANAKEGGKDAAVAKSATIEDERINFVGKKRPRKPDESETLRRLKAFESRIVKSRRTAGAEATQGTGNGMAAWFSRGLRLGTAAMEEEEYEVRFGPPSRANGRKKKR